jgi:hypothetical protein
VIKGTCALVALLCLVGLPVKAQVLQSGIMWPPAYNPYNVQPAVMEDMLVPPGDYILQPGIPQCQDGRLSMAAQQASQVSAALITKAYPSVAAFAQFGGAIVGQYVNQIQREVAGFGGSLAVLFSDLGLSPRYAACGTALLVIPEGYHITRYMYMAKDVNAPWNQASDLPLCETQEPPYLKCPIVDAAFQNTQAGNVVISTFINWARETRFVRVVLYFAPNY